MSSLGDATKLVGVDGEDVVYILRRKTQVPIPRTTMPDSPSKSKYCWYLQVKKIYSLTLDFRIKRCMTTGTKKPKPKTDVKNPDKTVDMNITGTLPSDKLPIFFLKVRLRVFISSIDGFR